MADPTFKPQIPKLTASIGVSTQSRPPVERTTHSIGVGTSVNKKERKETVFLDLRAPTTEKKEKVWFVAFRYNQDDVTASVT